MWVKPTITDLKMTLSDIEYLKYTTYNTGSLTPTDITNMVIQDTVNEIRGFIVSNNKNEVDVNEELIPSSLMFVFRSIACMRLSERLGGGSVDVNGIRMKNYERAIKLLDDIQANKFVTEKPLNPNTSYVEKDTATCGSQNIPLRYNGGTQLSPEFDQTRFFTTI
jgi:hypothetical protein